MGRLLHEQEQNFPVFDHLHNNTINILILSAVIRTRCQIFYMGTISVNPVVVL